MRKSILLSFLFACLLITVTAAGAFASDENLIDKDFAADFQSITTTVEQNAITEKYLGAWQKEFTHLASLVKNSYNYTKDKEKVDAYTKAIENSAQSMSELEYLNWSDWQNPPEQRYPGTGAASAAMLAQANIFKVAFFDLLPIYERINADNTYQFIYSPQKTNLNIY